MLAGVDAEVTHIVDASRIEEKSSQNQDILPIAGAPPASFTHHDRKQARRRSAQGMMTANIEESRQAPTLSELFAEQRASYQSLTQQYPVKLHR